MPALGHPRAKRAFERVSYWISWPRIQGRWLIGYQSHFWHTKTGRNAHFFRSFFRFWRHRKLFSMEPNLASHRRHQPQKIPSDVEPPSPTAFLPVQAPSPVVFHFHGRPAVIYGKWLARIQRRVDFSNVYLFTFRRDMWIGPIYYTGSVNRSIMEFATTGKWRFIPSNASMRNWRRFRVKWGDLLERDGEIGVIFFWGTVREGRGLNLIWIVPVPPSKGLPGKKTLGNSYLG